MAMSRAARAAAAAYRAAHPAEINRVLRRHTVSCALYLDGTLRVERYSHQDGGRESDRCLLNELTWPGPIALVEALEVISDMAAKEANLLRDEHQ